MFRQTAVLTLLFAWAPSALAATGVEWQWPDEEVRRYRVAADVRSPQPIVFSAEYNQDVRVFDFAVALDVSCSPSRASKKGWDITCDVTSAQFNATVAPADEPIGMKVLDEWDEKLVKEAEVTFFLGVDGGIKDFDVDGLSERNQRIRMAKETIRVVILRAFAAFDLDLPKNGDAAAPWKQKGQVALSLPTVTGMAGATRIDSHVSAEDGSKVTIDTTGRGALTLQMPQQIQGKTPDTYDTDMRSRAVFDTATGNMVSRSYLVEARLTPGSGSAIGVEQVPYVQAVELTHVPDGTPMDMLGGNAVKVIK